MRAYRVTPSGGEPFLFEAPNHHEAGKRLSAQLRDHKVRGTFQVKEV